MTGILEKIMEHGETTFAVQALWLQYKGLVTESAKDPVQLDNAAWQTMPPELNEFPGIDGLLVAM
ncbi:MAG: hypothetical protein GX651_01180 [Methanomicrobiales archaeon]|nr:hypothetical protein [Methanomicrobiales archaeon]